MSNSSAEIAWLDKKANFAASIDADQTEILAVRFGSAPIQEGVRDDKRSGSIADAADFGNNPAERSIAIAAKTEEFGGAIAEELRRRKLVLGPNYPFHISGATLHYKPTISRVYELCLCASSTESLSKKPFDQLPPAFERLCCRVSVAFLGARSKSVRTGWPRSMAIDKMPTKAKDLFNKIQKLTGEWVWSPDGDLPADPSPRHFKEQGLDLLTWIAMPDGRVGGFFLLGQCACGKTDWFAKRHDPDISILRRWFKPMTAADIPAKSLFVPFHIANVSELKDVSTKSFLIDRARIVLFTSSEPKQWHTQFRKKYAPLLDLVVNRAAKIRSAKKR